MYSMPRVDIFGKNIVLDKEIYIFLDTKAIVNAEVDKFGPRNPIYTTILDTAAAIEKEEKKILTTCTHFLSSYYMEKRYNIIVLSGDERISMADLLNSAEGRQIRASQNWEKMLYAGCFDINISF